MADIILPATDGFDSQFDFVLCKMIRWQKVHVKFHFLLLIVDLHLDFVPLFKLSAFHVQLCKPYVNDISSRIDKQTMYMLSTVSSHGPQLTVYDDLHFLMKIKYNTIVISLTVTCHITANLLWTDALAQPVFSEVDPGFLVGGRWRGRRPLARRGRREAPERRGVGSGEGRRTAVAPPWYGSLRQKIFEI